MKREGSFEKIENIIEGMIKNWKVLDKKENRIVNKIEDLLGKELSSQISIQKNRGNTLTVLVNSSALYHELSIYRRQEISNHLLDEGVSKVQFKLMTDGA